jgi:hypothetical protein
MVQIISQNNPLSVTCLKIEKLLCLLQWYKNNFVTELKEGLRISSLLERNIVRMLYVR